MSNVTLRRTIRSDEETLASLQRLAQLHPNRFEAHNNLGVALAQRGRLDEAAEAFAGALRCRPNSAATHRNFGKLMASLSRFPEAIDHIQSAIRLEPKNAPAHCDLGVTWIEAGNLSEARQAFQQAIRLNPDFATARWFHSMILLLHGEFDAGWPEYEWRWKSEQFTSPSRKFVRPRWEGGELPDRTILLQAEQGFGDTIQFVRYAEIVAARGAKVLLECPPELKRLMTSAPGLAQVICPGEPLPAFDLHCPLMSLPAVLKTDTPSIPARVPYLKADSQRSANWRQRLHSTSGTKVGIVWAGRSTHPRDRSRSIPLDSLAALTQTRGITFFSLQKGDSAKQIQPAPPAVRLINLSDELTDFSETAAVIDNLDLVVAVDTAVAHLAGAMGRSAWLLLPAIPDWRWLLDRDDSPWYPTIRLFRQKSPGDWKDVIERVAKALATIAGN